MFTNVLLRVALDDHVWYFQLKKFVNYIQLQSGSNNFPGLTAKIKRILGLQLVQMQVKKLWNVHKGALLKVVWNQSQRYTTVQEPYSLLWGIWKIENVKKKKSVSNNNVNLSC